MSENAYLKRAKGKYLYAYTKINGKQHHLGRYDSPESRQRYEALVAEHKANLLPSTRDRYLVEEAIADYLEHAAEYYVRTANQPQSGSACGLPANVSTICIPNHRPPTLDRFNSRPCGNR